MIATNREAFYHFHILETFEAGLQLVGTEVKSLREGRINLKDAYAIVKDGEGWLLNAHISPYSHGNRQNHDPLRSRKLLLHKAELRKLFNFIQEKGLTLVPTKLYFKNGKAKVELGLGRGKKSYDKRESIKKRETNREVDRALRRR